MPPSDHRSGSELAAERLADFLRCSADWLWETDEHHRFVFHSDAATHSSTLGFDIGGRTRWELAGDPACRDPFWQAHRDDLCAGRKIERMRYLRLDATGGARHVEISGIPRLDAQGRVVGYRGVGKDVTDLVEREARADEAARIAQGYHAALDEHAMLVVMDVEGRILHANERFARVSGWGVDELVGQTMHRMRSGVHPEAYIEDMWRTVTGGRSWRGEICNKAKDGSLFWLDMICMPIPGASGRTEAVVSVRFDITEKKRLEAESRAEIEKRTRAEELLREIIGALPDAVAAHDAEGRLILFNEAFRSFYARSASAIRVGATIEEIVRAGVENGQYPDAGRDPAEHAAFARRRAAMLMAEPDRRAVLRLGGDRWVQVDGRRTESGLVVMVRTDITELKQAEAALERHAAQDALTGLANRNALAARLDAELARAGETGIAGALLVLDVDHFKEINDTLGHDAGDALLQELARRLSACALPGEIVARLSGDEFAVLLSSVADEETVRARVAAIFEEVVAEVALAGRIVRPGVTIGVALYPEHGRSRSDVMKNADIALYEGKGHGRHTHCVFQPQMRAAVERRQSLTADLGRALVRDEIVVAFQPQLDLRTGTHVGFEALARWTRGGEPIAPPEFVSAAEHAGFAPALGDTILTKALRAAQALRARSLDPGCMAVNVTAAELRDPGFPARLAAALGRFDLTPRHLEIEITETVLLDRAAARIEENLRHVSELGVKIALDDFGTGYASLAHLERFPVDRIKIDRSFVHDIGRDAGDAAIVHTIVALGRSLEIEVVAEGVEAPEQIDFLRRCGCDVVQGYLIGKPSADLDTAAEHIRRNTGSPEARLRA